MHSMWVLVGVGGTSYITSGRERAMNLVNYSAPPPPLSQG